MIAHIVLFSPKAQLNMAERLAFAQTVLDVCSAISAISRFRVGRRIDVDPGYVRSFGQETYEFAAVLEFESQADLVRYLQDPEHHRLGRLFWESCDRTVVSEVVMASGTDPEAAMFLADRPN